MSRALDVLQMKEEDILKFLAARTPLAGTNFDFQMEQYIYKRKSDSIYMINLKRTWENSAGSMQPSGNCDFWRLLIPGLTTSLSQKCLILTHPPLLCVTQTLLCTLRTLLSHATTRELAQHRSPEETEKEEQASAEKAVTTEEFQCGCVAKAPDLTTTQPEVAGWSEAVQLLCAYSAIPY
ncbi:hypothetical protein HPG69_016659 [Diceros bicornis minor]|uniref:Small ribosomal subunit protein uS2 C-terminal domain-containing protein n=1 Tax=Diceros bicornis minor TaxID=77932 RepID=A0A7J7FNG8_DICBM|nr:hypothetical protein HPG69_016659 [Diceros bicornis minor]